MPHVAPDPAERPQPPETAVAIEDLPRGRLPGRRAILNPILAACRALRSRPSRVRQASDQNRFSHRLVKDSGTADRCPEEPNVRLEARDRLPRQPHLKPSFFV